MLTVLAAILLIAVAQPSRAQVVVANPSVNQASLTKSSLRAIFGMRLRNWENNEPIRVFVLPKDTDVHTEFCKNVLNVFPHQLQRAWDRLVFSGTGQAPQVVNSLEEMKQKLATTPGSVGYLSTDDIDEQLHVLKIQ